MPTAPTGIGGFIGGVTNAVSIAQTALNIVNSVFNQKATIRAKKLASDYQNAASGNTLADQDYLVYSHMHGDDVTRYEYDKLRAPYESQSRSAQQASGLFPVSGGTAQASSGGGESGAAASAPASMLPFVLLGVGALVLVFAMSQR